MTESTYESNFLSEDETTKQLAQKYQFTIFDFSQAKKEAHLKALKHNMLAKDYNLFAY
jgi:hypothetical protein